MHIIPLNNSLIQLLSCYDEKETVLHQTWEVRTLLAGPKVSGLYRFHCIPYPHQSSQIIHVPCNTNSAMHKNLTSMNTRYMHGLDHRIRNGGKKIHQAQPVVHRSHYAHMNDTHTPLHAHTRKNWQHILMYEFLKEYEVKHVL